MDYPGVSVNTMALDKAGSVLLGTAGGGVLRVVGPGMNETEPVVPLANLDGRAVRQVASSSVSGALAVVDDRNTLWYSEKGDAAVRNVTQTGFDTITALCLTEEPAAYLGVGPLGKVLRVDLKTGDVTEVGTGLRGVAGVVVSGGKMATVSRSPGTDTEWQLIEQEVGPVKPSPSATATPPVSPTPKPSPTPSSSHTPKPSHTANPSSEPSTGPKPYKSTLVRYGWAFGVAAGGAVLLLVMIGFGLSRWWARRKFRAEAQSLLRTY
jgi:hypothetical protein